MVGLIEKGQDARDNSDAIQGFSAGCKIYIRKSWQVNHVDKAGDEGGEQGFDIWEGVVPCAPDIDWREQAENIFNGLRQFPKLPMVSL